MDVISVRGLERDADGEESALSAVRRRYLSNTDQYVCCDALLAGLSVHLDESGEGGMRRDLGNAMNPSLMVGAL